jgi:hypothetical protein
MNLLVRSRAGRTLDVAFACALILEFAGCAPSAESPNPWADFRPAPVPVQRDATGGASAGSVDEHPSAAIAGPGLSVNLDDAPRFNLNDSVKHSSPQSKTRSRTEEYPPPAPPAEETKADAPQYALAEKPTVPAESAAESAFDVPAHWTGAVIYCQPGCVPCAMEIRDLRKAGWKCGVGDASHFKIVELVTLADFDKRGVPSTPQTVYFVDGVEQPPRITGYGGTSTELAALVNRHPKAKRFSRVGTALESRGCGCLSGGVCVCDGNCQCAPLASATRSTMRYAASPLWYEAAPLSWGAPVTSDACAVMYSAPVYVAPPVYAPAGLAIGPATHSAQLSLFGFPLIGGSVGTAVNW